MNQVNVQRENNFHLIRLLAAIQVLVLHHFEHFNLPGISYETVERIIWNFPGVNVFFIISGYLIFQSAERNSIGTFLKKRVKRIYPALIVCLIFTIFLLIGFNSIRLSDIFSKDFAAWIIAQTTFFQFYHPDLVRNFGFAPPNGALWTISVELQFYVFVSLFWYFVLKRCRKPAQNTLLLMLFVASAFFNYYYNSHFSSESLLYKLSFVFVLSYLYLFIAGAMVYINRALILPLFKGKAAYWLITFIVASYLLHYFQLRYNRYAFNGLSFLMLLLLVGLVFSIAYTKTHLSDQVFKGNDFSYGIYIYQMPVLNAFFQLKLNNSLWSLIASLVVCICLGMFSWFVVEKRFLKSAV